MKSIAPFLQAHGLRLNTDLGQHFLTDEGVLRAIVEAAGIRPEDHVVEIGPGIGVLTVELLQKAKRVTAIELDQKMIPLLEKFLRTNVSTLRPSSGQANERMDPSAQLKAGTLTIVHGNALTTPMPREPYIVVANIPYHITSPLLRHIFLESPVHPRSLTLLMQREVAQKICDDHDRGMLTILVGLFGTPRIVTCVPPGAFLPPPKVDSAVLHIACFEKPLTDTATIDEVFQLVKVGFSQKRKMLRNTIGALHGGMERLSALCIDEKRRPQTLTIEEWIALARAMRQA
jgi:16S rRNA (adenine1518-N6/adenine1519-N6)-dimethyltransferase